MDNLAPSARCRYNKNERIHEDRADAKERWHVRLSLLSNNLRSDRLVSLSGAQGAGKYGYDAKPGQQGNGSGHSSGTANPASCTPIRGMIRARIR